MDPLFRRTMCSYPYRSWSNLQSLQAMHPSSESAMDLAAQREGPSWPWGNGLPFQGKLQGSNIHSRSANTGWLCSHWYQTVYFSMYILKCANCTVKTVVVNRSKWYSRIQIWILSHITILTAKVMDFWALSKERNDWYWRMSNSLPIKSIL